MKKLYLLLLFGFCGVLLFAQVPLEYGSRFTGKYTLTVGLKYEQGDWGLGLNANIRAFNGPFPSQVSGRRPIDYNFDLGVGFSTFGGDLDLSASFGVHQVYGSAGLSQTAESNWLGTGVGLYANWDYEKDELGHDCGLGLRTSISPGVYDTRFSVAPSFTTTLVGYYGAKENEEHIPSRIEFMDNPGVGLRADFIPINLNPGNIGIGLNAYYQLEKQEKPEEPEEEEYIPINGYVGLNYQF